MTTKSTLDGMIIYLAGAMQTIKDGGVSYRRNFINKCKKSGLKLKFLDPTNKITGLTADVDKEKGRIDKYQNTEDWESLRLLMKKIVRQDLRQVDLSDMVIAFIDTQYFTCGTIEEVINAERQKKLVLIISEGGKKKCPAWLFGIIHYDYIFDSEEELIQYLLDMNTGNIPLNDKLILFRKEHKSNNGFSIILNDLNNK